MDICSTMILISVLCSLPAQGPALSGSHDAMSQNLGHDWCELQQHESMSKRCIDYCR
jgi:hypothetical protein